jgi:hypothetical protein
MNTLIRLIGEWTARKLEEGNALGATIGAIIGALIGLAVAYWMIANDHVGHFGKATYVIFSILGAGAGAVTGALAPARAHLSAGKPVRLNNLNRALLPAFFCLVLTACAIGAPMLKSKDKDWSRDARWVSAGLAAGALVAGLFAKREVLWIDVNESNVIVRRLLSSQTLGLEQVKLWGFEIERGKLSHDAYRAMPFVIVLSNGIRLDVPSLSAEKALAVVARLTNPVSNPTG